MGIKYYNDLLQGSEEWFNARCGLLTASEMKKILTPAKLQYSKTKTHLYQLLAQRITKYVEPQYITDSMLRGYDDEITARELYSFHYEQVEEIGFITNDKWGFTLGYSPDGLVGESGLVEFKSRNQEFQVEVIINNAVPVEHMLQCQTGLLVSEREWIDYCSYLAGLPFAKIRVYPDKTVQDAIINAASLFECDMKEMLDIYNQQVKLGKLIQTERKTEQGGMVI